jgi:DNA-binding HxlR family transcriptional regulator
VRTLSRLAAVVDGAAVEQGEWLQRVRSGLVAFLGFFDDYPKRARILLDHAQGDGESDGAPVARREQQLLAVLTGLLDEGSPLVLGEVMAEPQLISELVAGGVLTVIRRRTAEGEGERFVALAPELLAFAVAPYLGQEAARAQLRELTPAPARARGAVRADGRVIELPIRITHRTTLVLQAIAKEPGVSNREIERAAGPIDQGQLSNLLARLAKRGLIGNEPRGEEPRWPNAWRLTRAGERVVALIAEAPSAAPRRVRGAR